jgi:hypothetical protein
MLIYTRNTLIFLKRIENIFKNEEGLMELDGGEIDKAILIS